MLDDAPAWRADAHCAGFCGSKANAGCVAAIGSSIYEPFSPSAVVAISAGAVALAAAALAAVVGALWRSHGEFDGWTLLHWLGKPLATAILVWLVWRNGRSADPRLRRGVLAGLAFSLAGDVLLMLSPALRAPVIAYVVVLVAMAAQAVARWQAHPGPQTRIAAIGGVLFVASDALLATDRFRTPIAAAPLWVLGTYWAAQWGIAQSVRVPQRQ